MRKILLKLFLFSLAGISLSSCSYEKMLEKFTPKEEAQYAENFLESVRGNNYEEVYKQLHPDAKSQLTEEKFNEIYNYLPSENLLGKKIIGSQTSKTNDEWSGLFTFEYSFENSKWLLAQASVSKQNDSLSITSFYFQVTEKSLREVNKFTLRGKQLKHYLILLLAILNPLISIFTLIVCIRTPKMKRKVLWCILILIGIMILKINWTTGELNFNPLYLSLLSAGATASSPYSPWVITISIPLGVIAFWIKRLISSKHKQETPNEEKLENTTCE